MNAHANPTGFEISTDIPVPARNGHAKGGRSEAYPWSILPVGGSFFVPGKKALNTSGAQKRLGRKFSISCVKESGVFGVRVWRTA